MKRLVKIVAVFMILACILSQVSMDALAYYYSCGYELSFTDDFNGTSLDITKWSTQYPSGNSGEQQFYAPDAFTVHDGILKITAEKRAMQGYSYTSGIITTQGTFSQKYGLFTIRAKLPKGQGFWPAFWMLPIQPNYPTEIDVFEMLGGDPNTIYMSTHWRGADQSHQKYIKSYQGSDFSSDFHTFSLLWSSTGIIWYVDNVEQFRMSDGVPKIPLFLLVNLAVGGQWPGNPDITTPFPNSMEIDYMHVYQYQCHPAWTGIVKRLELFIHEYAFGSISVSKYHN
jgi:beta-glucanase (GH16 family)